jgi:RNA polymerase sigma factor (sigma-70 family)
MAPRVGEVDDNRPNLAHACEFDAETVRSVQAFLTARANRLVDEPRLLEAWDRFYSECDPVIQRAARDRLAQFEDAQDRAQEIWRVVVAHLDEYDAKRGPFRAWLRVVVEHALADQHRSRRVILRLHPAIGAAISGVHADPGAVCELSQSRERVHAALAKLRTRVSDEDYRIVHDHWFEGKSFPEIATDLGLTVKRVRDHHRRALGKLRKLLQTKN